MIMGGRLTHDPLPTTSPMSSEEDDLGAETSLRTDSFRALLLAVLSMIALGHCQYTWTLFVEPFQVATAASAAQVQLGFTCFVSLQTTSVLAIGVLVPSQRLRLCMCFGAMCLLVALLGLSLARSLSSLYVSAALMGLGVGSVYSVAMSISVRAFPRRRGLAAGIVAAGYGAGTLPTIALIERTIEGVGYATALRGLAFGLSLTTLVAALAMPASFVAATSEQRQQQQRRQERHERQEQTQRLEQAQQLKPSPIAPSAVEEVAPSVREMSLTDAAHQPSFWLLYIMLVLISFVGLVVTAQLKPIAAAYALPAASVVRAMEFDRVLNGVSRPLWGLASDAMGRENSMGLAFALQAAVLLVWSGLLASPSAFIACSGLSTFSWGEIYSLFPAVAADLYGTQHIGATYGALYTGKAVASLLAGPVASSIASAFSWEVIVQLMAVASALDALLALVALKRVLGKPVC